MQIWLYVHLPLVVGLAATGVAVEHLVLHAVDPVLPEAERWLLCGSLTLCYLSLGILHRSGMIILCPVRTRHRLIGVGALVELGLLGSGLSGLAVMGLVVAISLVQVGLDVHQDHPDWF